jgi:hypothetical protein
MSLAIDKKAIFDDKLEQYGTDVLVFTASGAINEYGDRAITYTGSAFDKAFLSSLTESDRQFLAEGERVDEMVNFYFDTSRTVNIGDKVGISGSTTTYEVDQLYNIPQIENTVIYKKARGRKL